MSITDLGERMPHCMIVADDGVHVMPISLLRDVIAGRKESSILTEPVVRRIIEEWMEKVGA